MKKHKKQEKKRARVRPLRTDAEKKLAKAPGTFHGKTENDPEMLIHELQVHQIELEMQNEELRNAHIALEESRDRYLDLYDFAPVGYFTFTRDALVAEVNLTGAALLGIERRKLLNSRFRRFVANKDVELWDRHIVNIFQHGEPQSEELMLNRDDGVTVHVRLDSIRMTLYDGTAMVRTAVSDITARKKAEDTLKLYADELMRSNKELEQFAYVASHDLQEPLITITGFLQLLRKKLTVKLDSEAEKFISSAIAGAKRMGDMIGSLLEYSRITTQTKPFSRTDCNELLKKVTAAMAATIEETGAVVTSDLLPSVNCDADLLARLFQNLLSNGIKFHKKNEPPRIHVSAKQMQDARGPGAGDSSGGPAVLIQKGWLFSVRDNGIGVDPKYHQQIFELFERLHSREEYSGTGMGLAICRKIIERHGGKIWLESKHGKGTTFYFIIPERG